jgi:hypothetical protein
VKAVKIAHGDGQQSSERYMRTNQETGHRHSGKGVEGYAGNDPALYLPAAAVQHSPQFLREVDNPKTSGRRALLRVDNL